MDFGLLHFFEHPASGKTEYRIFKEQLDTLRAAEDLGFDYIWAPEHHFTEYGFCASPMLTLAANGFDNEPDPFGHRCRGPALQ